MSAREGKPIRIRLMTDDVSGTALWPDPDWDYPGSPAEHLFGELEVEVALPISADLRDRIRAWVDEFTADVGVNALHLPHHDRRGHLLSRELQAEVGDLARIEYVFETSELRREVKAERSGS